jgi:putative RNA 2'-phosphotransferase
MNPQQTKKISRFLSLVLRHQPDKIGIVLDDAGWTSVSALLTQLKNAGHAVSLEVLETVVAENDKQRFQFSEDRTLICAKQGHSVAVELGYEKSSPPDVLCHGTPTKFVEAIRAGGLTKQKRHPVHLHVDQNLAASVGQRRGQAVVLTIDTKRMEADGYEFFVSPNSVWLTDHVPPEYITFPHTAGSPAPAGLDAAP